MEAVFLWYSFSNSSVSYVVCLKVGPKRGVPLVVAVTQITADMAPGAIWHPYHVVSALCSATCLGCWLEIEIQLSRLIRLSLRVHDRGLDRAIHKQCYPVKARVQSL